MIPNLSIIFMGVTAAVSIGLPVFMFIFWRKKYILKIIPLLVGMSVFVVFAMFLQQFVHTAVLQPDENGVFALLEESPRLFVIYAIFAAGFFEETGRFVAFKMLKRNHNNIGTGLAYGIGHGGIEAFLLVGLTMISNITVCLMINSGNFTAAGEEIDVAALIGVLQETPSSMFLISGYERVVAMAAHISFSIIVLCSVVKKGMLWLYPVAIVLHASVNLAPAMLQAGFFDSIWIVEGLILIPTALSVFVAIKACSVLTYENTTLDDTQTAKEEIPAGPTL